MSRVTSRSRQFLSTSLLVVLLGALLYACTESTFAPAAIEPPSAALSPADQALALQKISQLNAQVTAFRMSGDITSNKVANALSKYLDKATRAVRMGDAAGGIRSMNEFIAYVDSQPNSISGSAASVLKTLANEIIQILSRNSNAAPTATISSPPNGSTFQVGATINFSGSGSDPEDGALSGASLVWTSSIDGQIGTGTSFGRTLTIGVHTITLTSTDSQGATGTASVQVTVQPAPNQPPTATITAPANQSVFQLGTTINFNGSGNDPEDGALTGASLVWTSSIDGQIGTGTSFSRTLSVGVHTILLTGTDSKGATGTASVQIRVNAPPTATITSPTNQSVHQAGATINFSGSGSDPEDGALTGASLVWTSSINGPIGTGTSFSRTLSVAVHTITLTSTDSQGATGTASVQVTVQPAPNQPPTATITAPANQSVFQLGATISFNGSGNDPEDGALTGASLVWTSSIDGQIGTGSSFSRTLSVGVHTIMLTGTDSKGATGTASVQIRVNAPPTATITSPANQSVHQAGATINFNGSGSDPEDGALSGASLVWTSSIDGQIGTGTSFSRSLAVGVHTITLTSTDSQGATGAASIQITVQPAPNQPPTATITAPADQSVFLLGATISFNGSGSDPEDGALSGASLVWTSSIDGQIGTGTSFTRTLTVGVHTIMLTGTDSKGATGTASVQIRVNAPPTATITSPTNQSVHQAGATINFSGSGSDPEDGALTGASLVWSSSIDGQIGTGTSFGRTLTVGVHTITLTSIDSQGATGTASVHITIQPAPNQPPTATITVPADQSVFLLGATISFNGSGSDPEDGALAGASLVWTSSIDGQIGTGTSFSRTLSVGVHTIMLTGTDSKGATGTASVQIRVNAPPTAAIASPANQAVFQLGATITFSGSGNDPEDGALTGASLVWTSSIDGQIGTGASFSRTLTLGVHTITLTSTDSHGATATASVQIRVNAPPTATITSPATGSTFIRIADAISFQGSANDAENGALSGASLVWTSSIDGQIGTGSSFTRNNLSFGTHVITLTATDLDGATGTATITIEVNGGAISMPPTLSLAYTQSASVPLQLAAPAGTGGVVVSLTSSDPSRVSVTTPTVTIPEGQITANGTVQGMAPGSATVTATATHYLTRTSLVTTLATLNILQSALSFTNAFPVNITIQLESNGTPAAAPPGGTTITISASDPGCVAATSPVTIPAGQVQVTATVSYGGSATLPCNATLTASAADYTSDAVPATVTAAPPVTVPATTTGSGLVRQTSATLGASNHGGVTATITSSNPGLLLVSNSASAVGTSSTTVFVPNNTTNVTFWMHGVEALTGTATVTVSAPGFGNGSALMTVAQPALDISGLFNTTTQSPDMTLTVRIGVPTTGNSGLNAVLPVRPGGNTLTVTVTNSVAAVGQLVTTALTGQTVTASILPGQSQIPNSVVTGGVAFDPLGVGSTTVAATIPGFIQTTAASDTVTVTGPGITVSASTTGSGLVRQTGATLGATGHGGVTATITSSNPGVLLVSNSASTVGTASTTVFVPNGSTSVTFWIHGLEAQTGTATVTVTAPSFTDGSGLMTVAQPALDITNLFGSTTTLSPDIPFNVRIGVPTTGNAGLNAVAAVRPGGNTLTVTFTNSVAAVGQLVTTALTGQTVTASILPGQSQTPASVATGGVAFHALGVGSDTVAATIPGFIQTTAGSRTVTVTGPGITVGGLTTGSGLVRQTGATLGATGHGGVTATITSSNPGLLLVSNSASTVGTGSTTVFVPNGATSVSFWIHGLEAQTGTATVTVSAPGFTDGSGLMTVAQPALDITNLFGSTTTLSPDIPFNVRIGVPTTGNAGLNAVAAVRPGGNALTVTFTNSVAAVGQLVTTALIGQTVTAAILPGQFQTPSTVATGGVAFNSLGAGSDTVAATIPGFIQTTAGSRTVTVTVPGITLGGLTTGSGLVRQASATLGATNHGGVTVTITSSSPGLLLVSNSASTVGTGSTTVFVPNGNTSVIFWIHGLEAQTGTATVTVSAPGFTDGTALMTVVQPALDILSLNTTTTVAAADDPFDIRVGIPNPTNTGLNAPLPVRPGGNTLTVTVTNSAAAVGQLVTTALTAQTVTASILPGQSQIPSSVATGGVAFDALGVGTTTVAGTIAGFIQTTAAVRSVTVN